MEWLSEEEKTRSMMPYLLDLPPLDQPKVTEIHETKERQKSITISKGTGTNSAKDTEKDKWHCLPTYNIVKKPPETNILCSINTQKMNRHTNCKFLYDLKQSKSNKFILLSDSVMKSLRRIRRNAQKVCKNRQWILRFDECKQ